MLNQIDLSRTDLNLLVLFETVMQERHVGRSAERLSLSPSAVSHGLGRLRRMLGDPLFLKTPKGVVPTERATELSAAISEILTRVRGVVASATPFDPARSKRRFVIGAPDGVSAVFLPWLLEKVRKSAPGIDIAVRQVLPVQGQPSAELVWKEALSDLESRAMDIAVIPLDDVPSRFEKSLLFEEEFVVAARADHPFSSRRTLRSFCEMQHLLVSLTGDSYGFVDLELAKQGLSRRVALTVPNFIFALGVLAESDLISTLPKRLVGVYGPRFGIAAFRAPMVLPRFSLNIVAPKAALMDDGLAWLVGLLGQFEAKPHRHVRR
jgi:DNA-binding transcriptional LysR family regulator